MMPRARTAYEAFHRIGRGSCSERQVLRSSAGFEGWAKFADILESSVASRRPTVSRGLPKGMICKDSHEADLIDKLADAGGVVDASAHRQYTGEVVYAAAHSGLLFLMEGENCGQILVNDEVWVDVEFEVALDSGSTDNVCHPGDVPGYLLESSQVSRAGQISIAGNGAKVPNDGQVNSNLQTGGDLLNDITSTFQVAKVSRPLMSVGKLCVAGMEVTLRKTQANVVAPGGAVVCTFERQPGGLYVAKLKLKRLAPTLGRQG